MEKNKNIKIVILAGGRGVRMKSSIPKPLKMLKGKSMLQRVIEAAKELAPEDIVVVYSAKSVKNEAEKLGCKTALQEEPLGTADALKSAMAHVDDADDIIVTCADVPLIKADLLKNLYKTHLQDENYVTLVVARVGDPSGYGRVVTESGKLIRIVEDKEATPEEKKIDIINGGIYAISTEGLKSFLEKIERSPVKGEFYLTDLIEITSKAGKKNGTIEHGERELKGINSPGQLKAAEKLL